jgi:hypothetical protein
LRLRFQFGIQQQFLWRYCRRQRRFVRVGSAASSFGQWHH